MTKKYINVLKYFHTRVFASTHEKYAQIAEFLRFKSEGIEVDASAFEAKAKPSVSQKGIVAVIPMMLVIS